MVIYKRSDWDVNWGGTRDHINVGGIGEDHCRLCISDCVLQK
jgi:hypothetical protein